MYDQTDYQKMLSISKAYLEMIEGYKKFPAAKVQDKAAMKPDTAKGEKQARTMDTVRTATKEFPDIVKDAVKGQEMGNRKKGLEKKYNAPSAANASAKANKNKAYGLEAQRRKDLDTRYGPKSRK